MLRSRDSLTSPFLRKRNKFWRCDRVAVTAKKIAFGDVEVTILIYISVWRHSKYNRSAYVTLRHIVLVELFESMWCVTTHLLHKHRITFVALLIKRISELLKENQTFLKLFKTHNQSHTILACHGTKSAWLGIIVKLEWSVSSTLSWWAKQPYRFTNML